MEDPTSRFQLGTDLDPGSNTARAEARAAAPLDSAPVDSAPVDSAPVDSALLNSASPDSARCKDFFVERHGLRFAGTHLIIDLFEAEGLDDLGRIEKALRDCVAAAGATLLHLHLHRFTLNGGISGVAILAESHITIHSWPEHGYAALDVFMCGKTDPHGTIAVLRGAFRPGRVAVAEHLRGCA